MCTVSMVGDDFGKRWPNNPVNPWPGYNPYEFPKINLPEISRHEFEALKKEVESLKKLLESAKKYDEETGQHDCHMDEKVALIKKIASVVGVDMNEVFK